jgi:hypothetical protein
MRAPYQDIVAQLRFAFPKPVSDRMHDGRRAAPSPPSR